MDSILHLLSKLVNDRGPFAFEANVSTTTLQKTADSNFSSRNHNNTIRVMKYSFFHMLKHLKKGCMPTVFSWMVLTCTFVHHTCFKYRLETAPSLYYSGHYLCLSHWKPGLDSWTGRRLSFLWQTKKKLFLFAQKVTAIGKTKHDGLLWGLIKMLFLRGFEPGTVHVFGKCDDHYTTKTQLTVTFFLKKKQEYH